MGQDAVRMGRGCDLNEVGVIWLRRDAIRDGMLSRLYGGLGGLWGGMLWECGKGAIFVVAIALRLDNWKTNENQ